MIKTPITTAAGYYGHNSDRQHCILTDTYYEQQRLSEWFTWELNALIRSTNRMEESFQQLLAEYLNKAHDLYAAYALRD